MAKREPRWVAVFLRHIEHTGNVRVAAEGAGVDFTTAYQRRKRHADFGERWEEALEQFKKAPPPPTAVSLPTAAQEGAELAVRPNGAGSGSLVRAPHALTAPRWGKRAEEKFLTELTVTANVRRAAEAAGFSTTAVYQRRLKSRHFAAAWDAALEAGKARVQAYLVEAATRTFDPDELAIGAEREIPKVTIGEAINIAKMQAGGGPSTGSRRAGRGSYDDCDGEFVTNEEFAEAKERVFERLMRIKEIIAEQEDESGCCHNCGQPLPVEGGKPHRKLPQASYFLLKANSAS